MTFFEKDYKPKARTTIAASALPDGPAYYADLVRYFTTLPDATPKAIHETGLAEVKRIHTEMEAIVREVGFKGSFTDFLKFLRTEPQFYATTPEQLLWHAAWITREIDGRMPDFFGRIPRAPYTVKPVPAALAPNYTGGRYNPGPLGAAGEYWVNNICPAEPSALRASGADPAQAAPGHHTRGLARARARERSGSVQARLEGGEGLGLSEICN